jgi:hypothetical protein
LQEAKVGLVAVANLLDGGDVFRQAQSMIDVECLIVLYILNDLKCVKIDEDCVLFDLESVNLNEGVGILISILD